MTSANGQERSCAGGKIIVLGEHSVVYGYDALAGAIDRRVSVCAVAQEGPSTLSVPAWNLHIAESDEGPPARALRALVAAAGARSVGLSVDSNLPVAAGLGSSAALCLAVARSLAPAGTDEEHRAIAAAGEGEFHHQPSGIDVALCQYGGIARYSKAAGLYPLDVAPFSLVVALSGIPRSTATQVANVATRMDAGDRDVEKAIAAMGAIATSGIRALETGKMKELGACMSACHSELRTAGVSIPVLDRMVDAAMAAGASGAKLTGAGGGGAIIALAPGLEDQVNQALTEQGYESFVTTLGIR